MACVFMGVCGGPVPREEIGRCMSSGEMLSRLGWRVLRALVQSLSALTGTFSSARNLACSFNL